MALAALAGIGADKPEELLVCSLVRGRCCESLAPKAGLPGQSTDLFLLGLLSMTDAILARPMVDILKDMPVPQSIKTALLGGNSEISEVYQLVLVYERGEWERIPEICKKLHLTEEDMPDVYIKAAEFARELFQVRQPATPLRRSASIIP